MAVRDAVRSATLLVALGVMSGIGRPSAPFCTEVAAPEGIGVLVALAIAGLGTLIVVGGRRLGLVPPMRE